MDRMRFAGIALSFLVSCGIALAPVCETAEAAPKKQEKTITKKLAHKSSKSKAVKKTSNKTSPKSTASKSSKSSSSQSDRDIWLKRAKFSEAGKASWYGKDFHNKATASGLAYDMHTFTAAHRTLPMGTIVKVTDQNNGKSVMVCVTDRGPYVHGRIIDVSYAAAKQLGLSEKGVGKVALEVISDENGAPLQKGLAYYIKYSGGAGKNIVGPFHAFADAAAMHEALRQAHPEAEVILDKDNPR